MKLMRNDLIRPLCSMSSVKKLSIVVEIQIPPKKYNNLSQGRTQINTTRLYKNCKSFLIIYKLSKPRKRYKKKIPWHKTSKHPDRKQVYELHEIQLHRTKESYQAFNDDININIYKYCKTFTELGDWIFYPLSFSIISLQVFVHHFINHRVLPKNKPKNKIFWLPVA